MLRSKFVGCLTSNVIGNALGRSLANRSQNPKIGENFSGRWTDDAYMIIGVTEPIMHALGTKDLTEATELKRSFARAIVERANSMNKF